MFCLSVLMSTLLVMPWLPPAVLWPQARPQSQPASPSTLQPLAVAYRDPAARIIGAALTEDTAYRRLAYLSDRIGHRLSGSPQLQEAIKWAVAEMKRDGL